MFAAADLPYTRKLEKVPNSRRALVVAELARAEGVYEQLHARLFDAYWARGCDIGDEEILAREATAAGMADGAGAAAASTDSEVLAAIEQSTARAHEVGAGGVPAWAVDDRLLVPGAQPHEVFDRVMEQLGHEPVE
jgi:predicted DsbA family dithiol-disulfide isomerase